MKGIRNTEQLISMICPIVLLSAILNRMSIENSKPVITRISHIIVDCLKFSLKDFRKFFVT